MPGNLPQNWFLRFFFRGFFGSVCVFFLRLFAEGGGLFEKKEKNKQNQKQLGKNKKTPIRGRSPGISPQDWFLGFFLFRGFWRFPSGPDWFFRFFRFHEVFLVLFIFFSAGGRGWAFGEKRKEKQTKPKNTSEKKTPKPIRGRSPGISPQDWFFRLFRFFSVFFLRFPSGPDWLLLVF